MTDDASRHELPYGIPPPGYRLPAGIRLGRVRLQIEDLDRSVEWYRRVVGLEVLDRRDGRAVLGTAGPGEAGEVGRPLVVLDEKKGATPVGRRPRLGLYHFAILLPDRAALGRFVQHLDDLGVAAGASDHLVSEALYLRDPDGLGIEVYTDRPRTEWRHRGRELVMTTEPLDLRDLVRAGGGGAWGGLPPGTVLGHVHLHVGDLARASAFYHEALGLDRVVWSYPGALFLSAGGYHHHLGLNTWAADAPPAGDDDARLLDWELLLPDPEDVERALESVAAAGNPVEPLDDGGIARDPWGTAIRLLPVP
jgi:catechol 2,3-dioxygenase